MSASDRAHVTRILADADGRLRDADVLSTDLGTTSDSPYLLRLLAFELLLKAVCFTYGKGTHGHKYEVLFGSLPLAVKRRILKAARHRIAGTSFAHVRPLLALYSSNFVNLRYSYERYEKYTMRRYRKTGRQWLARRAPVARAHFRYRPEELQGLLHALQQELHGWLGSAPIR
jgi:hypothetical protein